MNKEHVILTGKSLLRFKQFGYLGYYHLIDWWVSEFTDEERKLFKSCFVTMGMNYNDLISGEKGAPQSLFTDYRSKTIMVYSWSATKFLTALVQSNKHGLGLRILNKAKQLLPSATIMDVFTLYGEYIRIYKRDKNWPKMVYYCKRVISLSPFAKECFETEYAGCNPVLGRHIGFEAYCKYLYSNGEYEQDIIYSQQAKEQGWSGEWDKRISRCQKRIIKNNKQR